MNSIKEPEELCVRGRGRPRDEEARRRILEAALALVEDVGFTNATTDSIAERAGASKSTIYRWWPNKAAVLIDALREQVALEQPFPITDDVRDDLIVQLQNFIELLASNGRGRLFKAFIAAAQSDPEVADAFRHHWIQPRRAEAKAVLEHHQANGGLREGLDLGGVLDMIYGPIYFRLLAGHCSLTADFAREVTEMALRGIQTCEHGS